MEEVLPVEDGNCIRSALIRTTRRLHQRRWCDGTGGNFSVVQQRKPLLLLMAPSGVDKGQLDVDDLIVVNEAQDVVEGSGRVSAEAALHQAVIEQTDAGAVLHTHSIPATVLSRSHQANGQLSLEGWEMLKGLAGVTTHATRIDIPVVANNQCMDALVEAFLPHLPAQSHGILVSGHGLYAWGRTLADAERHLEILEFLLEVQLNWSRA